MRGADCLILWKLWPADETLTGRPRGGQAWAPLCKEFNFDTSQSDTSWRLVHLRQFHMPCSSCCCADRAIEA
ncbi:hypothetical protein C2W62_01850 [Candidatus Entotheonella serta]|nr:hypothetical protein C2W62_01850 [Candidatus Entotheonella serta]